MKKLQSYIAVALCALLLGTSAWSCDKSEKDTKKPVAAAEKKNTNNLPNYRYVDVDTILSRYLLAKDYNEEMVRMQTNAEGTMRSHEKKLQSKASEMQKKMDNNGYLTKESYDIDQRALAVMQNEAQRNAAALQNNMEQSAILAQKTITDSINAFIEDYNKTRGYDAIFYKGATMYINPALDITEEVIEGLNARYNKVKK